jgi:DNA-binding GntR family transcriptional regulator
VFSPSSISVDRSSPVPLYYQVAHVLEQAIESGALPAGTRLDNEIALAEQLGLSRPTMRRAIEYLVDRGLLVRKRGVGTQVVKPPVRRPVELTSLHDDLERAGKQPRTEVLDLAEQPASPAVARALQMEEGEPVVALERLRYAGDEPLALMRNFLPPALLRPTEADLERHGLYELLRRAGVRIQLATQTIGAVAATTAQATLLRERRGAPLLTMHRIAYDDEGRPVEYGDHHYRASLYSFELVLTARAPVRPRSGRQ